MALLLRSAFPVDQAMTKPDQIRHLPFTRLARLVEEGMEQRDQKLGFEKVVFLVYPVDEPAILKDVEKQATVFALFVGFSGSLHDVGAGCCVENQASVLLLDVFGEL